MRRFSSGMSQKSPLSSTSYKFGKQFTFHAFPKDKLDEKLSANTNYRVDNNTFSNAIPEYSIIKNNYPRSKSKRQERILKLNHKMREDVSREIELQKRIKHMKQKYSNRTFAQDMKKIIKNSEELKQSISTFVVSQSIANLTALKRHDKYKREWKPYQDFYFRNRI